MTTPAQQLYSLPEPVQIQLLAIAREAIGMSTEEKYEAKQAYLGAGMALALMGADDTLPAARMLTALATITHEAGIAATTTKEVV
jgi:hypothetical protein